ncbi:MAG: DNA polymerase III subunit delta [Pseudomonadota bacterium]
MKAAGARARAMLEAPPAGLCGFLLYGSDAAEVDAARAALCAALVASGGEGSEVSAWDGAAARRDPAGLHAALRAAGLFGGRPVISLTAAGDGVGEALRGALDGLAEAGALVATAGQLPARSKLRKLFEDSPALLAASVEATPLTGEEIAARLTSRGAPSLSADALAALSDAALGLEPAELRNALELLALYMLGQAGPIEPVDVAACLPGALHGELDRALEAVAARRPGEAAEAMARAAEKGASPVAAAMMLGRHLRQIHALATAQDGPVAAAGRLRPPVWGPRRDALVDAARHWPPALAERALSLVLEAELSLRSTGGAPDFAAVQRLAVRTAGLR